MSQSTTISPSPTSRKPVALSRNDPFSMPVIHCLGFFLGMTASSLSVSTLMARSSSVTRAHDGSAGGSARTGLGLATAMSNTARDDLAKKPLETLKAASSIQKVLSEGPPAVAAGEPLNLGNAIAVAARSRVGFGVVTCLASLPRCGPPQVIQAFDSHHDVPVSPNGQVDGPAGPPAPDPGGDRDHHPAPRPSVKRKPAPSPR